MKMRDCVVLLFKVIHGYFIFLWRVRSWWALILNCKWWIVEDQTKEKCRIELRAPVVSPPINMRSRISVCFLLHPVKDCGKKPKICYSGTRTQFWYLNVCGNMGYHSWYWYRRGVLWQHTGVRRKFRIVTRKPNRRILFILWPTAISTNSQCIFSTK